MKSNNAKASFPHDADAHRDGALVELLRRFGKAGGYEWWVLVELLREAEDYRLKRDLATATYLQQELGVGQDYLKRFMETLVELGLLQTDRQYYWSEELRRRLRLKANRSIATPSSFKSMNLQQFYEEVLRFASRYPKELLSEFFDYWREPSASGKMRFQLQDTWDTNLRLRTWARKPFRNTTPAPVISLPQRSKEELQAHWQNKLAHE